MAEYESILLKFLIEKYLKMPVFRHFDFLEYEVVLSMYTKIVPLKTITRLRAKETNLYYNMATWVLKGVHLGFLEKNTKIALEIGLSNQIKLT
jgi:hypothetical protein